MTSVVDPKHLAVWPLPDLYEYLCTISSRFGDKGEWGKPLSFINSNSKWRCPASRSIA